MQFCASQTLPRKATPPCQANPIGEAVSTTSRGLGILTSAIGFHFHMEPAGSGPDPIAVASEEASFSP